MTGGEETSGVMTRVWRGRVVMATWGGGQRSPWKRGGGGVLVTMATGPGRGFYGRRGTDLEGACPQSPRQPAWLGRPPGFHSSNPGKVKGFYGNRGGKRFRCHHGNRGNPRRLHGDGRAGPGGEAGRGVGWGRGSRFPWRLSRPPPAPPPLPATGGGSRGEGGGGRRVPFPPLSPPRRRLFVSGAKMAAPRRVT